MLQKLTNVGGFAGVAELDFIAYLKGRAVEKRKRIGDTVGT